MNMQRKSTLIFLIAAVLILIPQAAFALQQNVIIADAPTTIPADIRYRPDYIAQLSRLRLQKNDQESAENLCHTIVQGENLSIIAKKYGVTVEALIEANNIKNPNVILPGQVLILAADDKAATSSANTSRVLASRTTADRSSTTDPGFIWPSEGNISSGYGPRWGSFHYGLDIAAAYGSPIVAVASGVVADAGWRYSYGYMIRIDHENGWVSLYAHCSKLHVSTGQKVQQGQKIAAIGQTGNATGSHVHLETIYNDKHQNPLNLLPAR